MSSPLRQRVLVRSALAVVASTALLAALPVRVQTDSIWVVPTAVSLARQLDLDLSEYGSARARVPHGLVDVGEHTYSTFPVGPSIVAAAFIVVTDLAAAALAKLPEPLDRPFLRWRRESSRTEDLNHSFFTTFEVIVASLCASLGGLAVFFVLRRRFGAMTATFLVCALLLGSPATSTWTRALWSHGPAFLCLAVAAWLALERPPGLVNPIGTAVAVFAVVCRPTAAPAALLLVVAHVALGFKRSRRQGVLTVGAAVLSGGLWLALSLRLTGAAVPQYYRLDRLELSAAQVEALLGNLVSPSRGLLVYCPVVLLALGLPWVGARRHLLSVVALGLGVTHLVVVSLFPHWWGGHCFGARLPGDAVPFLLLAAAPVAQRLLESRRGAVLLSSLVLVGVVFNLRGAAAWSTWHWNETPQNVDDHPSRVWDWSDPQFAR